MAKAIYNKLTNSLDADSAGTHPENPGETLGARRGRIGRSYAVDVMKAHGLNPEAMIQTQLTKEMLKKYDLVVGMAAKKYTPTWLAAAPNYRYWKITDPKGRSYETTDRALRLIEAKIRDIVA